MYNPIRRNRNIGTAKQGYGKDNKLVIPQPADTLLEYYETFINYKLEKITVHGRGIKVILEELKNNNFYSLSPFDAEKILNELPKWHLEDIGFLIFRQPKRKENILSPVWGRLIYSFEFNKEYHPAIIIEAFEKNDTFNFPKKQSVERKADFIRLKNAGFNFQEGKRDFIAKISEENIRNVQLYHTLLHEVGHYVQYTDIVEKPGHEGEEYEKWQLRWEQYLNIPAREKEVYAHRYAEEMKDKLLKSNIIPFRKIEMKEEERAKRNKEGHVTE